MFELLPIIIINKGFNPRFCDTFFGIYCPRDKKQLFSTINKVMHRNQSNPMPEHSSPSSLANDFKDFFRNKIAKIQQNFSEDETQNPFEYDADTTDSDILLDKFQCVSEDDVRKIIINSKTASCELGPFTDISS